MSVSLSNSSVVYVPTEKPIQQENSRPAKDNAIGLLLVGIVAAVALLVIGSIVAGITLVAFGAVTCNPILVDAGVYLLAATILGILGSATGHSFYIHRY